VRGLVNLSKCAFAYEAAYLVVAPQVLLGAMLFELSKPVLQVVLLHLAIARHARQKGEIPTHSCQHDALLPRSSQNF